MFKFACLATSLVAAVLSDILDIGEETGEIMLWSSASKGFNDVEEFNGNLDDLECFMTNTYYGRCESDLTSRIGDKKNTRVEKPYVVAYFVDEVYSHDDLFQIKQSYGASDYNYVEILGMPLETSSQFYHRLNSMVAQSRYRLYPSNFKEFKDGFKYNTQLTMIETETVKDALALSKQVTKYAESQRPDNNLISIIAPAKAQLDEVTILRRNLLNSQVNNYSACNTSDGDYCLDYWCNRTSWDSAAYTNSCIDQYDLFGLMLAVFLFIPFCCIGCCCLDGIQTPLRFPSRVLPVRKEF